MPAYNAAAYIPDAIRSVLDQTWRDLELIIVDDGSTDATTTVAESVASSDARVRLVSRPNGGPSAARNTGIDARRGELIAFLDADDVLLRDKLERQVAFLDATPACDLVYSDYYVGDEAVRPQYLESTHPASPNMSEYILYRNRFAPLCPLLRATLVEATGRFDESLHGGEDWDYWIRAAQLGRFCHLAGPVGIYRTHPAQAHHDHAMMSSSARRVASKNFPRGSRQWRISLAARAWAEGREAWWDRRLHVIPIRILEAAVIARSPRLFCDVMRWA
jgi:glycosyltransferase involved in cell wall biosynthesis